MLKSTGKIMKARISDIQSEGDASITILHFLETYSSPEIEIQRIRSEKDISIRVDTFFHESPDYQSLHHQIILQQEKWKMLVLENAEDAQAEAHKLEKLMQLEKAFKIDVLKLADIFLRLNITSERLVMARHLFEQGRFKEADAILLAEDLCKDQDDLLIVVDYLERRKEDIVASILAKIPHNHLG